MSPCDDESLVAAARAGRPEAFGKLVVRHQQAMLAVARSFLASEADVEDAVQDAFVKAFNSLDQLRSGGSFAAWVTRITINTCVDVLRARTDKVSLADFASTVHLQPRLGDQQFTPATLSSRGEQSDLIKAAIGSLPEHLRMPLLLRYSEDMTYDEIAAYLALPATTVQGRLHRAKRALRSVLRALSPG
jgi:RNA polymerase sigma-70 factor (ECF subfamily)